MKVGRRHTAACANRIECALRYVVDIAAGRKLVRGRAPAGPIAIVARHEHARRQARLFAAAVGHDRGFPDYHVARKWLDELPATARLSACRRNPAESPASSRTGEQISIRRRIGRRWCAAAVILVQQAGAKQK
jgi:hypothetical protein